VVKFLLENSLESQVYKRAVPPGAEKAIRRGAA